MGLWNDSLLGSYVSVQYVRIIINNRITTLNSHMYHIQPSLLFLSPTTCRFWIYFTMYRQSWNWYTKTCLPCLTLPYYDIFQTTIVNNLIRFMKFCNHWIILISSITTLNTRKFCFLQLIPYIRSVFWIMQKCLNFLPLSDEPPKVQVCRDIFHAKFDTNEMWIRFKTVKFCVQGIHFFCRLRKIRTSKIKYI